jgi:hypothetical protein
MKQLVRFLFWFLDEMRASLGHFVLADSTRQRLELPGTFCSGPPSHSELELSSSHPPHPAILSEQDELEPVVGEGRGAATGSPQLAAGCGATTWRQFAIQFVSHLNCFLLSISYCLDPFVYVVLDSICSFNSMVHKRFMSINSFHIWFIFFLLDPVGFLLQIKNDVHRR